MLLNVFMSKEEAKHFFLRSVAILSESMTLDILTIRSPMGLRLGLLNL